MEHRLARRRVIAPLVLLAIATTSLSAQDPNYVLAVDSRSVVPGADFRVDVTFDTIDGLPLSGWSYGVCHDPTRLTVLDLEITQYVLDINFGAHPFFHQTSISSDGFSAGVIVNSPGNLFLEPGVGPLLHVRYEHTIDVGEVALLEPCETIGTPATEVVAVLPTGQLVTPITIAGTLTAFPAYVRGDANADGAVDIADPLFILNHLFVGGPAAICPASADVTANTVIDLADPIALLAHLFSGGPPPEAPYPECGGTSDQTTVDCPQFSGCP